MCCALHILPVVFVANVFDVSCAIVDACYQLSVYFPFFCHCFLVLTNDNLCVVLFVFNDCHNWMFDGLVIVDINSCKIYSVLHLLS